MVGLEVQGRKHPGMDLNSCWLPGAQPPGITGAENSGGGLEARPWRGKGACIQSILCPQSTLKALWKFAGQLLASQSLMFIVCLNALSPSHNPNLLFKVSAMDLL